MNQRKMTPQEELYFKPKEYNITNPKILHQRGRCYRINESMNVFKSDKNCQNPIKQMPQTSYNDYEEMNCEGEYDEDVLCRNKDNRFEIVCSLPCKFFPFLNGIKGSKRKQLEKETETTFLFSNNDNRILIQGYTKKGVFSCKERLEIMCEELRAREKITHFVSIPLISDEIKENFNKFKEMILAEGPIEGVEESIFQNVDKIHLTIGVLVLLDETEKQLAIKTLNSFKTDHLDKLLESTTPLTIKIKGLEYMNDDPQQVDVLYGKVTVTTSENSDILQKISDLLVDYFQPTRLMRKERDYVKLHATLMNSRYRNKSAENTKKRPEKRKSFNVKPILDKFKDFDFGEQRLDFLHLSERSSVDETGYYKPICQICCIPDA